MESYWEAQVCMRRMGIEHLHLHVLSLRCLWNTQAELLTLSLELREVGTGEIDVGDISLSMVIKAMGKQWNHGGTEKRAGARAQVWTLRNSYGAPLSSETRSWVERTPDYKRARVLTPILWSAVTLGKSLPLSVSVSVYILKVKSWSPKCSAVANILWLISHSLLASFCSTWAIICSFLYLSRIGIPRIPFTNPQVWF